MIPLKLLVSQTSELQINSEVKSLNRYWGTLSISYSILGLSYVKLAVVTSMSI